MLTTNTASKAYVHVLATLLLVVGVIIMEHMILICIHSGTVLMGT